ncbi:hypothetical protein LJC42_06980 [Eubacteriales bacterium OttesenSCG-928-K08]|nr:hypothetical protein [Eubacteriales bacterium OttesenSCG-928-K08]
MDSSWITWIIQGAIGLGIGAFAFFAKRTLNGIEGRLDKQEKRVKELEDVHFSLSSIETRMDKHEKRVDKLEADHNDLKNRLPLEYTRQEEFLRSIARIDNKLDKIHDTLLRQGGAQ